MKIGIAAATYVEIQPTINFLQEHHHIHTPDDFKILITGIGSLITTYKLTDFFHRHRPRLMIQAGIGGSFTKSFQPGEVALIKQDVMGDIGVEEHHAFRDVFDMGLMEKADFPFNGGMLVNPEISEGSTFETVAANGVTVNEITTNPHRIQTLREKYVCDIESMEGAAFHYVCLREEISFLQFRAVSNMIGERDKKKWNMPLAIDRLNDKLLHIIQHLA